MHIWQTQIFDPYNNFDRYIDEKCVKMEKAKSRLSFFKQRKMLFEMNFSQRLENAFDNIEKCKKWNMYVNVYWYLSYFFPAHVCTIFCKLVFAWFCWEFSSEFSWLFESKFNNFGLFQKIARQKIFFTFCNIDISFLC